MSETEAGAPDSARPTSYSITDAADDTTAFGGTQLQLELDDPLAAFVAYRDSRDDDHPYRLDEAPIPF